MAASNSLGTTASDFLYSPLVDQLYAKGVKLFLQFCEKIQSSMHQIFIQIYLTVSIGPSHKESPTELFIKKFFFRWSTHFPTFELPNKNPPKSYMSFQRLTPPSSLETTLGNAKTQPLITNFLSINPPQ